MKKIVYICTMLLFNMDMMAQIDLNDKNWDTIFIENFSGIRGWSSQWQDLNASVSQYTSLWRCYANEWRSGVTTTNTAHQAYRPDNAAFGRNQIMKLIGEFHSQYPMTCEVDYYHAPNHCCTIHPSIHYYSGMIETIDPVGFGYYEVECQIPVHRGSASAFWFWSTNGGTYNEIDVFEHANILCYNDMERETVSGIWYNPDSTNYTLDTISGYGAQRYAPMLYILSNLSPTLESYHRFGCLWMPEQVVWYVDGNVVNECHEPNHIPQYPMHLKITHLESDSAIIINGNDTVWWEGSDEMTINYIKAYRLKTNCSTNATIRSLTDFYNFNYQVCQSINMGGTQGLLSIPSNINFTMRAVDSITINGGFELPSGTGMTLIIQDCPEWPDINKNKIKNNH